MPLVSVVVPIYNVERYLSFCLDSLRSQTLRDIEIICVLDGPTDRSADVAKMHAGLDGRIKIVEKENGGLSSARNAGIDAAAGDYLLFVDSDDFLEKKACEVVLAAFEEHDADVVTFGAHCVPESASNPWLSFALSPRDVVYEAFDESLLFDEGSHPFAWRTALKRSFVERCGIRFDEALPFGEDQVFHFEVYPLSGTTVLLSDKLYSYRMSRKDSLMGLFATSLECRVPRHIEIVEAILRQWDKRGLMDLCPERLIDWILDFLCFDIFDLPDEKQQVFYLRKLGATLDAYFDDPVTVANATFPVLGEVVSVALELNKREQCVPARAKRRYRRYRIGLKRIFRQRFSEAVGFAIKKDSGRNALRFLEGESERIEREGELSSSLLLLLAETACKEAPAAMAKKE